MSKSKIFPHDRYLKSLMANKKVALEFFETHLPETLKKDIDFSTLELRRSTFIDDKLKMQEADLLYSVQIRGEEGYFYLLVENASTLDKMLPYRLLKYMISIMDDHLKKTKSKTLPFIFPLVLYTGKKSYKYSMDIFDLFKEHKELAKLTLFGPYTLIDLTQVSDEELKKYTYFGTMAFLTKHIHDPDIVPALKDMLYLLKELEKLGELEYIDVTLSYIVEAGKIPDEQELFKAVKQLETISEEKLMTIAEYFKQEGRQEGRQEGEIKAYHKMALDMLKEGEPLSKISKYTALSLEELKKIKNQIH